MSHSLMSISMCCINSGNLRANHTANCQDNSKAPFTRDRIQMGSDPFGSDPLFKGRLHGIGSRIVGVYKRSDPFGFYELLGAL